MAGIYLHIPFCKQACYYCDFHFSTSLKRKAEMLTSIKIELLIRKEEVKNQKIETIYFGGGTPSLLTIEDLNEIFKVIYCNYNVVENPEITLEANPDDLTSSKIVELATSKINRLSIGIQSFFEDDLQLMNRAHNAQEAINCLTEATHYFKNISVDLIYGIPGLSNKQWKKNIDMVLSSGIKHISSYALTVEPKTALESLIKKGMIEDVSDLQAQEQFYILVEELSKHNFTHYELSNFAKDGAFSINNSSYWQGKSYLGIGPSAHSFDGKQRSWNVKNNSKYISAIQQNKLPIERELLSITDQYNEYVMTGLRTIWGVSLEKVTREFGKQYHTYLLLQSEKYIAEELLYIEDGKLKTTRKGKFLSDGISADLFKLDMT